MQKQDSFDIQATNANKWQLLEYSNQRTFIAQSQLLAHNVNLPLYHGFLGTISQHQTTNPPQEHLIEDENTSIALGIDIMRHHLTKNFGEKAANYQLKLPKYVHGNKVHVIAHATEDISNVEADALVTNLPGIALITKTADCVPILLCGSTKKGVQSTNSLNSNQEDSPEYVIAAIHAGWRGAIGGIIENTVNTMVNNFKLDPSSIKAAIGPSIMKENFEVGHEVYGKFFQKHPDRVAIGSRFIVDLFTPNNNFGQYLFDLPGYCQALLQQCKINQIDNLEIDTYAEHNKKLYSYRKMTHSSKMTHQMTPETKNDTGRQLSFIIIP